MTFRQSCTFLIRKSDKPRRKYDNSPNVFLPNNRRIPKCFWGDGASLLFLINRINIRSVLPSPLSVLLRGELPSHSGTDAPMSVKHYLKKSSIAALWHERRHDDTSRVGSIYWNILTIKSHREPVIDMIRQRAAKCCLGEIAHPIHSCIHFRHTDIRRERKSTHILPIHETAILPVHQSRHFADIPISLQFSQAHLGSFQFGNGIGRNQQGSPVFRHPGGVLLRIIRLSLKHREPSKCRARNATVEIQGRLFLRKLLIGFQL